jgi:hypothetical protein
VSPGRIREVRRRADVRVLRRGMPAHVVGEVFELDYGAATARIIRSITRPPTRREAEVFREELARPGSLIESFEYEYLDDRPARNK